MTVDRDALITAFALWESDYRAGKCAPLRETDAQPIEKLAPRMADALLDYLAAASSDASEE